MNILFEQIYNYNAETLFFNEVDPCDRDVWRSSVRSAMHAASQLPGSEPTDVDNAPASAP